MALPLGELAPSPMPRPRVNQQRRRFAHDDRVAVGRDGMNGWLYLTGVRKCLAARQLARLRAQSANLKRKDDNDAEHH